MRVKLVNKLTGSVMYVDEKRAKEYITAGHKPNAKSEEKDEVKQEAETVKKAAKAPAKKPVKKKAEE